MFGDNNNENMNFDSVPNISFNSNGQPIGNLGSPIGNSFPNMNSQLNTNNGQFIPPNGLDNNNSNNTVTNANNIQSTTPNLGNSQSNFNMFACNDCNSTFGVSNGGIVEECIFCHGHNVVKANTNVENIDGFIPFSISRDKAISDYKSKVMLNPIIPLAFKSSKIIDSIKKVYVSGRLYNILTAGDINFLGIDNNSNVKTKFDVLFNVSAEYENVFCDGCSKIEDKVFNAIENYRFDNITLFDVNNIGQCYFLPNELSNDINNSKLLENCKKHTAVMTKKKVNHQMRKLQANNSNAQITKSQNIIVPIYMLSVKYNNKNYMYIMNGETGKYSLDVTYGKLEVAIFSLLIGLIVFGVTVLVSVLF